MNRVMKHYSAYPTMALDSSHAAGFGQLDINNYAGAMHRETGVERIHCWLCCCWLKVCLGWPTEGKQSLELSHVASSASVEHPGE